MGLRRFSIVVGTLAVAAFGSCGGSGGIPVGLEVAAIENPGTITFMDSATGTITSGHVAIVAIGIIACAPPPSVERWLAPTVAHAHGTGTPTRSAEPVVLQLVGGVAHALESLAPPADDYCFVDITIGPPDADAVGQPPTPVSESVAITIDSGGAMSFSTSLLRTLRIALPSPLVLESDDDTVTLLIHFDANAWLAPQTIAAIAADPNILVTGASPALRVEVVVPAP